MNPTDNSLSQLNEIISKAKSGVIALPLNPSVDAIASATALYLGFTKLGKSMSIACSTIPDSDLIASDKIQASMATTGDNLIISFPYTEGAIDKVDYSIQGSSFNLIISPRPGQPKLESDKVQYTYSGGTADFIITIDTPNLNSLGQLYADNEKDFEGKTVINIDRHLVNDMYGTVNLVNKTSSSTSEIIFKVLENLTGELDKDMATNLYAGIIAATNNFTSYSVNANTFETAANLLRFGALKKASIRQNVQPQPAPMPQNQNQNRNVQRPMNRPQPQHTQNQFRQQPQQPQKQHPQPLNGQINANPAHEQQSKPIEAIEPEPETGSEQSAPQDWLKPKIFRGGGLV